MDGDGGRIESEIVPTGRRVGDQGLAARLAREIEGADTAQTGAEEQREQLCIRQRRRTALEQLFARALGRRPMADGARGDRVWMGGLQVRHADSIVAVTHRRQR